MLRKNKSVFAICCTHTNPTHIYTHLFINKTIYFHLICKCFICSASHITVTYTQFTLFLILTINCHPLTVTLIISFSTT